MQHRYPSGLYHRQEHQVKDSFHAFQALIRYHLWGSLMLHSVVHVSCTSKPPANLEIWPFQWQAVFQIGNVSNPLQGGSWVSILESLFQSSFHSLTGEPRRTKVIWEPNRILPSLNCFTSSNSKGFWGVGLSSGTYFSWQFHLFQNYYQDMREVLHLFCCCFALHPKKSEKEEWNILFYFILHHLEVRHASLKEGGAVVTILMPRVYVCAYIDLKIHNCCTQMYNAYRLKDWMTTYADSELLLYLVLSLLPSSSYN